ncbi:MAG: hypothetical protein Q4B30_06920 [Coriobacteriaceae bacterium]|nr:hypothetical protein [Coriobacteriaceae bacterium]
MNIELDAKLMDVLSIVYESGANRDIILIGSWAAYLYDKARVLNSFKAPGKTRDMDFLVKKTPRILKRFTLCGLVLTDLSWKGSRITSHARKKDASPPQWGKPSSQWTKLSGR